MRNIIDALCMFTDRKNHPHVSQNMKNQRFFTHQAFKHEHNNISEMRIMRMNFEKSRGG